ncbi:MAG: response regulator [Blastocatellia bacterium]
MMTPYLEFEKVLSAPGKANIQMSDKILVVDDEQSILFAMRDYFTAYGYDVDCARELEEANTLLSATNYSVVIADLRLTGLNGTEGLEIVEYARKQCPWTSVIILTAYGVPEIEREAMKLGVDAFLRKPKPLSQIAQIVFGLLANKPRQMGQEAVPQR